MKQPRQTAHKLETQIVKEVRVRYLLHLPRGYGRGRKRWPLILFLHGAGERGSRLSMVKKHGPPKLIEAGRELPFIVVSPQCPKEQWWSPDVLSALLDEIVANYAVDEGRIYLTGLSMGGRGTWTLATACPERFAAIAPVCGWCEPFAASRLKDMPTWVFHGAKDPIVPVAKSRDMYGAMKAAGSRKARLTIYLDAGHDSWTETYENPKLYAWLLRHRRRSAAGKAGAAMRRGGRQTRRA